jgi:DHA3 family macrolide efflux protein-like MFS transporter
MSRRAGPRKFRAFLLIWSGQVVSLTGSGLTGFALGVWVYQRTGSVTQFALISLFTSLPGIVFSPIAGALVDRWDRRWAMLISDAGAGLCTLSVALPLSCFSSVIQSSPVAAKQYGKARLPPMFRGVCSPLGG